jgi:hypothetical protein
MVAQGNALRKIIQKCVLVLKGQHKRVPLFCPFRQMSSRSFHPGRCPGLRLPLRFSATKPAIHFFTGVVFCGPCNLLRLFRASVSLGLIRRAASMTEDLSGKVFSDWPGVITNSIDLDGDTLSLSETMRLLVEILTIGALILLAGTKPSKNR